VLNRSRRSFEGIRLKAQESRVKWREIESQTE